MMNLRSFLMSNLGGLVIEVHNSVAEPDTPVDVNNVRLRSRLNPTPQELAAAQNQFWWLVNGPDGGFYIQSKLGPGNLVIQTEGRDVASGRKLQLGTQSLTAKNQLWQWAPTTLGSNSNGPTGFFLASMLDKDLVIDIKGGRDSPGSLLQVFPKKRTTTQEEYVEASNQIWTQMPILVEEQGPTRTG